MDNTELIINILINLFFTVTLYEIVPLILKYFMKKYYTKKEARKIATINTVCVYFLITILYIVCLDESKLANPAAAFIWGTVAFNILKNNKNLRHSNNEKYSLTNNAEITGDDIAVRDMLKQEKITQISLEDERHGIHSKPVVEIQEDTPRHLSNGWKTAVIILSILTIVMTILFINSLNNIELLDEEIVDLKSTILTLKSLNNNLEERNDSLQKANEKAVFLDKYIVIRPANTNIYHKYGCKNCDTSSFYIYDINEATANGYTPCNNCISSSSKSSWENYKEQKENN